MGIPILILIIFVSLSSLLAGQTLLHWFQLESYQFPGFFRTLKRNLSRAALPGVVLAVVFTGISLILHLARIGLMSMSIPVCISISLCEMAASVVLLLWDDGMVTGVESIGTVEKVDYDPSRDGNIYTISGQRLSSPRKGINIINGRKVIVK